MAISCQCAGDSQNGMSYSASQGVVNQTMAMLPMQPGAMVGGVPSSTTANLNIGVDYWAAPGSALSPQRTAKRQLVQLEETNGYGPNFKIVCTKTFYVSAFVCTPLQENTSYSPQTVFVSRANCSG